MAPSPLDKHAAGYNSPHNLLMSLAMDLELLCVICEVKMAPVNVMWLFSVLTESLRGIS